MDIKNRNMDKRKVSHTKIGGAPHTTPSAPPFLVHENVNVYALNVHALIVSYPPTTTR